MVTVQLAQLTTRHMSPLNYMLYTPFTFFHMLLHVVSHALLGVGWKVCVRREVEGGGPGGGGGDLVPNLPGCVCRKVKDIGPFLDSSE